MKAILCRRHGGPEVMEYCDVSLPELEAGELMVKAEAIGVNFVDTMRRSGSHPTAPKPPFTPGIELCGRIVAGGPKTVDFEAGMRVLARCVSHGAYAEYVRVEARFAVPCPEEISAEDGAALYVNGQTAYHALITLGKIQRRENVLITAAAGGVGTCAIQIAKLLGARVLAAAGSEEKRVLARQLGADVLVDYTRSDWPETVMAATKGRGADLILESVGGDIFKDSLRCWALRGRMVVFGKASGVPGMISGDDLLFGHRTAHGLAVGTIIEDTSVLRSSMKELLDWHAAGKLRLVVGHKFPLSEAADAHRLLESRQSHGKIILIP